MADDPSDYSDYVNRRSFVKAAGVTGAAALAGCSGGGNNSTTTTSSGGNSGGSTTTTSQGNQVYDVAFKDINFVVPQNLQFNPFNPNKYSQVAFQVLTDVFARYDHAKNEFVNYGISDMKFDPQKATLTIRDGLTWFDGTPVTSKDVVTQFRLQKYMGNNLWQYAKSVEAPDDKTVVVNLDGDTNPEIVKYTVTNNYLRIQDQSITSG